MSVKSFARAIGLLALLIAAPALAQNPAQTAAPTSGEPTAGQIALGRDIVVGSGVSKSFSVVVPQFLDQIGTRLTQTRPDLIKDLNAVMEQIKPEFDKRTDEMIDKAARLYATNLSEQDLKTVADFYKSPAGVKYVATQTVVLNGLYVAMQGWSQQMSTDIMTRVREEMKKKGHEL